MKKISLFIVILFIVWPSFSQTEESVNNKTSTYFFIRHAEKDRSDKNNKNPSLTMQGRLRAAKWSLVLDNVKFDAIYSTDYKRTIQTAQPTAEKNNLDITIYTPSSFNADSFLEETNGKTVLIVGHSNTTPLLVNKILNKEKYTQIKDSENGNLYMITVSGSGEISDALLVIN